MHTQERGNLLAERIMGFQRYLQVVRHSARGVATAGEDADERMENPELEEEEENDPTADGDMGACSTDFEKKSMQCCAESPFVMLQTFSRWFSMLDIIPTQGNFQQTVQLETM